MKKPKLNVEAPQPRNIQRADIAPSDGYALVVDGHFKTLALQSHYRVLMAILAACQLKLLPATI